MQVGYQMYTCHKHLWPLQLKPKVTLYHLAHELSAEFHHWTLGGDFNLIRFPKNRNKLGGDIGEMNLFNKMISDLDLVEIPFSGRNYT